jgi:hypothetical protein
MRRRGGEKMERTPLPGPQRSWPAALRAARAWLGPSIMLWRYWTGWSNRTLLRQLQRPLDRLCHGHGIPLYRTP